MIKSCYLLLDNCAYGMCRRLGVRWAHGFGAVLYMTIGVEANFEMDTIASPEKMHSDNSLGLDHTTNTKWNPHFIQ